LTGLFLVVMTLASASQAGNEGGRVDSPGPGETWSAGSTHAVTWSKQLWDSPAVTLELTTDGGATWEPIVGPSPNSGEFLWVVPDRPTRSAEVRVVPSTGGGEPARSGRFEIGPSTAGGPYRWVSVNPKAAFAARDGAGALSFRGKMWLIGGWNPGDKKSFPRVCNNEVWSTPDGASWTLEKPNTFLDRSFDPTSDWEGRHTAGYVVFKDRMWVVGGDANQGHYQNDVWSTSDGRDWRLESKEKSPPWAPRALHMTAAFRDQIWVIGGQTMPGFAPSEERFYRDVWKSSDGRHWERVEPAEPYWSPRGMIGGSVVLNDRLWLLGGGTYDTPTTPARQYFNDVWSTADGAHWTRHTGRAPWAARQYHDVAAFDGRMWVMEGYAGANRNDVWSSADGLNWYELKNTPWKPRHAASVFVFEGALWMVAGNNMEPDVWKLVRDH